jgi:superfamily II DNA/RNA helicase
MVKDNLQVLIEKTQIKTGIDVFNEMQLEAFEFIPHGADTILISETGSGKTFAFLLPIMSMMDTSIPRTQVLIIAPTRELVLQIKNVAQSLALGYNITACYGGHPVRTEKKELLSQPIIIVGTPGRMLDHLERENINAEKVKFFVLDEFDKSLEMGFHKQMKSIIKRLVTKPQYILTSATDLEEIPPFVPLKDPQKISFNQTITNEGLVLKKLISPNKDKLETLKKLITDVGDNSTFIFCNYRESVERISTYLKDNGIENDYLHGGLDQIERENKLTKFRNHSTRILVTTDLVGRGIDIPHVENIVHYHFPVTEEVFTHRNGRTARMNRPGNAFVIISAYEEAPEYIDAIKTVYDCSGKDLNLKKTDWITLHINRGKKDKISKGDVAGYLIKSGKLNKEEVGLIEIKDQYILVAVQRKKAKGALKSLADQKLKGKKAYVKIL